MPLADEMRPQELFEIVGQEHILGQKRPLSKIVESKHIPNMVFYGPPGVGKTTAARIIARKSGMQLYECNAINLAATDIREIISSSKNPSSIYGTLMYLDEVQYLNKKQQQMLLEVVEDGALTLIASTTENPYFSIYKALLSRCTVFEFKSVSGESLRPLAMRAFEHMQNKTGIKYTVSSECLDYICCGSGGDVRKCLNAVELTALAADSGLVTIELVKLLTQKSNSSYDRDSDGHYDTLSALQKSIRGSDPDAALHYTARLITAEDLQSLCRRLLVIAAEDVGLAYPQAIAITKACVDSALQLGLPEARIPLAEAVILLATAPKSNSAESAIDAALADVHSGKAQEIPRHLQNTHCDGKGVSVYGQHYLYPHEYPNHWIKQQYLPDNLVGKKYYTYGDNKFEQGSKAYWENVKNNCRED